MLQKPTECYRFINGTVIVTPELIETQIYVSGPLLDNVTEKTHTSVKVIDLEGDWLVPGLVDIHVDYIDSIGTPRGRSGWPILNAFSSYDSAVVAAGITTIFDAVRIEARPGFPDITHAPRQHLVALRYLKKEKLLRGDHFVHLRCEILDDGAIEALEILLEEFRSDIKIISAVTHLPEYRQFKTYDAWYKSFHLRHGFSLSELNILQKMRTHNFQDRERLHARVSKIAKLAEIAFFTHDDNSAKDVQEAKLIGSTACEFPMSLSAVKAAEVERIPIIVGAPNLVMGSSHVGNMSAKDALSISTLGIISSDYAPYSLVEALCSNLPQNHTKISMIEMATSRPSQIVGLGDRGSLLPGKRADFIRIRFRDDKPYIREVWTEGCRVH